MTPGSRADTRLPGNDRRRSPHDQSSVSHVRGLDHSRSRDNGRYPSRHDPGPAPRSLRDLPEGRGRAEDGEQAVQRCTARAGEGGFREHRPGSGPGPAIRVVRPAESGPTGVHPSGRHDGFIVWVWVAARRTSTRVLSQGKRRPRGDPGSSRVVDDQFALGPLGEGTPARDPAVPAS